MVIASDIIAITVTNGLFSKTYTIDAHPRTPSDFDTLADAARQVIGIHFDKAAGHVKGSLDLGFTVTAEMFVGKKQHDITEQFMRAGWKSYGFDVVEPVAVAEAAEPITADDVAAVSAIVAGQPVQINYIKSILITDTDDGDTRTYKLTAVRQTYRRVAKEVVECRSETWGQADLGFTATATMNDGIEHDITRQFIEDAWTFILETDDYNVTSKMIDAAKEPLRYARLVAVERLGVSQSDEDHAVYEAALAAERAAMPCFQPIAETPDDVAAASAIATLATLNFNTFGQSQPIFGSDVLAAAERRARIGGHWFEPARPVAVDLHAISAAIQTAAHALYNEDATVYEEHPIDVLREAMMAFRRLIDEHGVMTLDAEVMCEIVGHVQIAIENIKDGLIYVYPSEHGMTADVLSWADVMELFTHPERAMKTLDQGLQEEVTLNRIYGHLDLKLHDPIKVTGDGGRIIKLMLQIKRNDQCVRLMMKIIHLIEAEMVEYESIRTCRHDDGSDFNPGIDLTLLRLRAQDLRHRCMIIGHQNDAAQAEIDQLQISEIPW